MFNKCSSLIFLNLSNFKTSLVKTMNSMFSDCSSLISLDISNFNTSQVTNMNSMFKGCSSLSSLDLSNFETTSVTTMCNMFSGCSSLNSLDLSNFKTSKVTTMDSMFKGCSSLSSLDLSNFDTSQVKYMDSMFVLRSSLNFLDLSNFDALQATSLDNIFHSLENLENINLKNAKINPNLASSPKFLALASKLTICTEDENWAKIFDLSDKQYVNCINNISYFNPNENEHILKCYKNNIESDNPCQMCGYNYSNITGIINNTYINCYENYHIEDTTYQISIDTSINNNEYYHIEHTSYQVLINTSTIENSINTINIYNYTNSYLIEEIDKNQILTNQISNSDYSFFDTSIIIEKEIEIKNRTELIQNMINNLFNKLNISDIDEGKDEKTGDKNISVIITSTKNQKKNENENAITIDLGKCENILKEEYNISTNEPLYILEIISREEGMKIPKIDYEIYYPFYNNITKLDLNLCKGTKIEISIPVKINDTLDKYNPKSGYYNDVCYKTTSESGTDISLKVIKQHQKVELI